MRAHGDMKQGEREREGECEGQAGKEREEKEAKGEGKREETGICAYIPFDMRRNHKPCSTQATWKGNQNQETFIYRDAPSSDTERLVQSGNLHLQRRTFK